MPKAPSHPFCARPLTKRLSLVVALTIAAPFAAVRAQGHSHDGVPPGREPPRGQCRIWFEGRSPGHQPLPTDCQTAFRDAPPDARVLVGAGVDRSDYDQHGHDHGEHRGSDNERGNKHGDRDDDRAVGLGDSRPAPTPVGDCLAYTSEGRCAEVYAPPGGPRVLPDMVGAVFASEGRVLPEVQRWLGRLEVTVHVDAAIDSRPTRVRWTDARGHCAGVDRHQR